MTIRINLFPNPDLSPTGLTSGLWGSKYPECFPGDGTLVVPEKDTSVTTAAQKQGYVQLNISNLLNLDVEYVFSAVRLKGTGKISIQYVNTGLITEETSEGTVLTYRFVPSERGYNVKNLMALFDPGTWTRPSIEAASTYDMAKAAGWNSMGPRFFSGNSFPLK